MRTLGTVAACAALTLTLASAPAWAQPGKPAPAPEHSGSPAPGSASRNQQPQGPASVKRDGYFRGYVHKNYDMQCHAWLGSDPFWGACNDIVSSVQNMGYIGAKDDVMVYKDANYTGYRRGIYNGVWLDNLDKWVYDGAPFWETLNDSISSHQWTNLP
ncbi:hypothetical protein [Streptomyces sp. NPDC017529]|uniref:hypothetical protein n=1 Tax=Streptomyces sp. NPDC017529 TaxID=3365000 RepID=UPI0037968F95